MVPLHPEFLLDDAQKPKSVVLPIAEWEAVLAELEELEDIRAYDAAKSSAGESIPFEQAVREIREDYGA